ncbi:MAG: YcnI family protein, partial [Acidimicrobiia bacterium]
PRSGARGEMREKGRVRRGRALTGAVLAGLSGAVALGVAAPASGHVSVNPGEATKGGFTKLSFRVPNERDNAGTTKIEVTFPEAQPVAHVSVRPQTGWTVTIQKAKLARPLETEGGDALSEAVSRITWQGGLINPGEFEEFEVSAGPLPEADRMVFKAVQTYSSGEVVRWIEEPAPGGEEPDTPAPVLRLLGAESTTTTSDSAAEESESGEQALAASELASRRDVDSARRLAFAGIALGALGLALGLKRRR